jgi:hypothetical protein
LVSSGRARKVLYLEPPVTGAAEEAFVADLTDDRGLTVCQLSGSGSWDPAALRAILEHAEMRTPVHLNFGAHEVNWWFRYALASIVERSVLVLIEPFHVVDEEADWAVVQRRVLSALVKSSDAVWGVSMGSIEGAPGARYLGMACDLEMEATPVEALDTIPEPSDLGDVPRPRALYSGALSFRIDVGAIEALADSGVNVVIVGFESSSELTELLERHPRVTMVGARKPAAMLGYYRHCDIGIVPHTSEAITKAMEPRKVYNYCAAGLRPVLLGSDPPPRLTGALTASSVPDFVAKCHEAIARGRLEPEHIAQARRVTWADLAERLLSWEPKFSVLGHSPAR